VLTRGVLAPEAIATEVLDQRGAGAAFNAATARHFGRSRRIGNRCVGSRVFIARTTLKVKNIL